MALLQTCGIDYRVESAAILETVQPGEQPADAAIRLAREKAEAVGHRTAFASQWVLAADTVVADGSDILGKPIHAEQARDFLLRLRGRSHQVITGLCLLHPGMENPQVEAVTTRVRMRDYAAEEIESYIASGDPFDKAGGYAIQHSSFRPVAAYEGCFANVVGLPICRVYALLEAAGWTGLSILTEGCRTQKNCRFRSKE
jgi:septum formation protein